MRYYCYALFTMLSFFSCNHKTVPAGEGSHALLKVMSYNVHHCNPPSKPDSIDIAAIATVIKREQPDIVALQEIDVHTKRSGNVNEAAVISSLSGLPYFYFAKAIDFDGGGYGVMILSRFLIKDTVTNRLPTDESTKGEHRVLATATLLLPGGQQLKFGCTHLDAQKENTNRLLQAKEIQRLTAGEKMHMMIAGDFNTDERSEIMEVLDGVFTRSCTNCAPTIPVIHPRKAIDFIMYRPVEAFSLNQHTVIREEYASDHLPVMASFKLEFKK